MTLLRSALFNLWFTALTTVMLLASIVIPGSATRFILAYVRLWARLVLGGLRLICGITVELRGREHLPAEGGAIIASQHQSAFDTMVWLTLLPDVAYVLKKELRAIPLFGRLSRHAGMIAVDRGAGAAALRGLLKDGAAAAAAGRTIVIFPEGTRTAPGAVVPLQPGVAALASRTGLPVIPVATDSGRHWGRRAFAKRAGVIHIAIQPPLPAGLPRAELLARLETALAEGFTMIPQPVDNSVGVA